MTDEAANHDEHPPDEPTGADDGDGPEAAATSPTPYRYDPSHAGLIGPLLAAVAPAADELYNLGGIAEAPDVKAALVDDGLRREIAALCLYRLVDSHRNRTGAGAVLVPLDDPDFGWSLITPIADTTPDVRKLWEDLAASPATPLLDARYHDLCFSAKHGKVGDHGAAAVAAYLLWPTTGLPTLDVAEGIARAWTIARAMSNEKLEHDAFIAARDYVRVGLNGTENAGTIFTLLEIVASTAKKGTSPIDKATLCRLLDDAYAQFPRDDLQVRVAQLMRRIATDDAERTAADRAEVQAHLTQAARRDGGVKMLFLRNAAQAARDLGIKDLEAQAVEEMQAMSSDDLGMQHLRHSVETPPHFVLDVLRNFDEANDWRSALHQFLHTPSPSGSHDRNVELSKDLMRGSLHRLFPTMRFGAHGLPQQSVETDDEQLEDQVTNVELFAADNLGRWYAHGLHRMPRLYGIPPHDEITAFLMASYNCHEGLAHGFATSLRLFWQEEYNACLHIAVPRVEEGARELLLRLNAPVYRVEQGKKPGQFPGLGFLLPRLVDEGFDKDWERFIGMLLLPRGHNLRNLVAHGFVDGISPGAAALALRAAGLMTIITPSADSTVEPGTVRHNLGDPLALRNTYRRLHPIESLVRRGLRMVHGMISKR